MSLARKRAAATVVELGGVGGEAHVIERAPVEPGVELAEGAGVGAAGVCADRGVDQAARGRGRRADLGVGRGDLSECIITHNGKAGSAVGTARCCAGRARLPWHPAAGLALPAEDGRLWRGGKRAGWNRGHDPATGAPLNRAARDGESVRAVARALRCGLATVQRARLAV